MNNYDEQPGCLSIAFTIMLTVMAAGIAIAILTIVTGWTLP